MTDGLHTEIVEYIRGERGPVDRRQVIVWLQSDAKTNPAWSTANYEDWDRAIETAIEKGLLVAERNSVRVAPKVLEPKTEQLELF